MCCISCLLIICWFNKVNDRMDKKKMKGRWGLLCKDFGFNSSMVD